MKVFYNQKGVGDVLLVQLNNEAQQVTSHEKRGNVVKLYDEEQNTIGYNLFLVREEGLVLEDQGLVELDTYVVNFIEKTLHRYGFEDQIEVDLSPKVVVGEVVHMNQHPDADRLQVCTVDVGDAQLQIVCGAPNVSEGQRVVVAKAGAFLPGQTEIKPTQLRGVDSEGMICSAKELNLENAPQEKGILTLNKTYQIGEEFLYENRDYRHL